MLPDVQKPSFFNFLMRRKSFWLCVFVTLFLGWARYESSKNYWYLFYSNKSFMTYVASVDDTIFFETGKPDPWLSGFSYGHGRNFHQLFLDVFPSRDSQTHIRYRYLILIVWLISAAWLTWRWRLERERGLQSASS
jgi:hypothetical protein